MPSLVDCVIDCAINAIIFYKMQKIFFHFLKIAFNKEILILLYA